MRSSPVMSHFSAERETTFSTFHCQFHSLATPGTLPPPLSDLAGEGNPKVGRGADVVQEISVLLPARLGRQVVRVHNDVDEAPAVPQPLRLASPDRQRRALEDLPQCMIL